MTKPIDIDMFHSLINALTNQTISSEQHVALQEMLKSSPEARQLYLDFIDLHLGLRTLERTEQEFDPMSDRSSQQRLSSHRAPRLGTRDVLTIAPLATAAVLLISISSWFWLRSNLFQSPAALTSSANKTLPSLANAEVLLTQAAGASFFGESIPSLNSSMAWQHEYALTNGMIELHFPAGATAIIESPAVFLISNASRLKLQTGQCSVYAPDGAQGFQVETPITDVVDLGTRFSVSVDETGGTDVQVVEGIAEVFNRAKNTEQNAQPVRLTERQARTYSEIGSLVSKAKEFDDSQYRRGLPDRVVTYQATDPNGRGAVELVDVTVQRGGQIYTYPIASLTGVELIHFKSASGKNASPIAYRLEDDRPQVERIIEDRSLNTGVINPGGAREPLQTDPVMAFAESAENPNTPGMAIRFLQPVINDIGPDIVFFDLQTFNNPPSGDAFHIGPVLFEPGLRTHTIKTFDITMNAKEAKVLETFGLLRYSRGVDSIQELKELIGSSSRVHTSFRALAVGIDLSDLGYNPGTAVESLFIQDAMDDDDSFVDPVFIGGLPSRKANGEL